MADPWSLVAEAVNERRLYLRWSWDRVAEEGGPSVSTLNKLVNKYTPIGDIKKRELQDAIGWPDDRIDRILAGESFAADDPPSDPAALRPAKPVADQATEIKRLAGIQAGQTVEIQELSARIEALETGIRGDLAAIAELLKQQRSPARRPRD